MSEIGRPALGLDAPLRGVALGLALVLGFGTASLATPAISSLSVRPSYFTPNGDGLADSCEVSFVPEGGVATVEVRVEVHRVLDDALMATPLPLTTVPVSALITRAWNPGPIADGAYRFDVLVREAADSLVSSAVVVADTTAPNVSLGAVGPNPFDPAAAPPNDHLHVPVTVVADTTTATLVRVFDSGGVLTDSLGTLHGSVTQELAWDGKTLAGVAAATGVYSVRAFATDLAGNADTSTVAFTLDRDPPVIAAADTSAILQTDVLPLTVEGTATDFDRVVSVTRSLDDGETYAPVDFMSAAGPSVTWETAVPAGPPHRYSLRVRALDALGHLAEKTFVVAYDDTFPEPISQTVLGDGSVEDGEILRIRSEWRQAGLHLSAKLSTVDTDWLVDHEDVVESPAGTYLITYRISPTNLTAPGHKNIVITASTGIVAVQDSVGVELLDAGPRAEDLVAVSHNRFDPKSGERVTISAPRASAVLRVEIYNLAGERVRKLEGRGFTDWDGRGEGGFVCGAGVYFLRVDVNGDVEIRRVAVAPRSGS